MIKLDSHYNKQHTIQLSIVVRLSEQFMHLRNKSKNENKTCGSLPSHEVFFTVDYCHKPLMLFALRNTLKGVMLKLTLFSTALISHSGL